MYTWFLILIAYLTFMLYFRNFYVILYKLNYVYIFSFDLSY